MSVVGLCIGESFAEISGSSASGSTPDRWYLPRKSLAEGLRDHLGTKLSAGGILQVASYSAEGLLHRQILTPPALLVTEGFENWLSLHNGVRPHRWSSQARRAWAPLSQDHVFGISERVTADGKVTKPLDLAELEFLVKKLELSKIKSVAIGFLHAIANPQHEQAAAAYLESHGLQVFCSHQTSGTDNEVDRWWKCLLNASLTSAVHDQRTLLQSVCKPEENWTIKYWSDDQVNDPLTEKPGLRSLFGLAHCLQRWSHQSLGNDAASHLHLGFERFYLVKPGRRLQSTPHFSRLNLERVDVRPLKLQPTELISLGFLGVPTPQGRAGGYEPGPMIFGKSLQLSLLDILFQLGRLGEISVLTELISEKAKARIEEQLFTLGNNSALKLGRNAVEIAAGIESLFIHRLELDLLAQGVRGKVLLTGGLAPAFLPLLQRLRPNWTWQVHPDFDSVEPLAAGAKL